MRRKIRKRADARDRGTAARLCKAALAPQKENEKKQPLYDAHEALNLAANEGEAA